MELPTNDQELIKFKLKTGHDVDSIISRYYDIFSDDVVLFDRWLVDNYDWLKNYGVKIFLDNESSIIISLKSISMYGINKNAEPISFELYKRIADDNITKE